MSPILGIYASQVSGKLWPASSYESIQTVTVGAGGISTVTFSSIPSTYTHLQIRALGKTNRGTSGDIYLLQLNGNSSSSNYTSHALRGNGTVASSDSSVNTRNGMYVGYTSSTADNANTFGVSIIDILDYANTNKYKVARSLDGADFNGTGLVSLDSSVWLSTSAVTSIVVAPTFGTSFSQYSSFALYGIKVAA